MKKIVLLFVVLFLTPVFISSQTIENLDFVSPFSEGLSAIKKDNQWAFINNEGTIVIDFRNDLVTTNCIDGDYPIFVNNRCLIVKVTNGISYFGYINTNGKIVIEPEYLNATNFIDNEAIVLKLTKEAIGENDVLGKNVVQYKYYDVILDTEGHIKQYLTPKGFNIALDKKYLKKPPKIIAKKISDNLYAVVNKNKKWTIIKTMNANPL
jgi:hypothetical protein